MMSAAYPGADRVAKVGARVRSMYAAVPGALKYHDWTHVSFVERYARQFAVDLQANQDAVSVAAFVHDLNYLEKSKLSGLLETGDFTEKVLLDCGFSFDQISTIKMVVSEAQMETRGADISREAMALSDADSLYKSLPVAPMFFAPRYLEEQRISVVDLANMIVSAQKPLLHQDIYFYSPKARSKFLTWARTNVQLWENVLELYNEHPDLVAHIEEITRAG